MNSVYIIDDEASIRRSTSFLLNASGYSPRAFVSGADFLEAVEALKPGVVLVDLRMPDMDGLALAARIPAGVRDLFPVVMITGHGDLEAAVKAMRTGIRDFLEKPFEEEELLAIVDRLAQEAGRSAEDAEQRSLARGQVDRLTSREREVLVLLAAGKPNKGVAHELNLSIRTVEMHRAQMLERLGVRTLPEATRLAVTAGLLS